MQAMPPTLMTSDRAVQIQMMYPRAIKRETMRQMNVKGFCRNIKGHSRVICQYFRQIQICANTLKLPAIKSLCVPMFQWTPIAAEGNYKYLKKIMILLRNTNNYSISVICINSVRPFMDGRNAGLYWIVNVML